MMESDDITRMESDGTIRMDSDGIRMESDEATQPLRFFTITTYYVEHTHYC